MLSSFFLFFGLMSGGVGCVDRQDVTEKLIFSAGDTFEIRPTLLGVGVSLPDFTSSTHGMYFVTINQFVSGQRVDLKWHKTEVRENKEEIEEVLITGGLENIDLEKIHTILLPNLWIEGRQDLKREKSAVWLSDDAFQALIKTRETKLELSQEKSLIGTAVNFVERLKEDPALLRAEPEEVDYKLRVNGQAGKVSAIKAKNKYGEFLILNNGENPVILKFTPNAFLTERLFEEGSLMQKIKGFSITNVYLGHD